MAFLADEQQAGDRRRISTQPWRRAWFLAFWLLGSAFGGLLGSALGTVGGGLVLFFLFAALCVVTLGWNNRIAGEDTTRMGPTASYSIELPDTLATWVVSPVR